ncbi:helix-turn-helix domain-containing protein [Micromonospora sp. WMMD980]|uniref:helix-turn-helix domain-containing protein n=1 Tax=Micromonospora sp. WMMD980 TaxID=3016088 RepID=UPI0024171AC7|nr:helix-turn-helix domain-containing protein [Micromonospora sp. WMMD980]MDG4799281.1 helix-turn-helix domain-containing protein [Micromonospora sp. WMMD980]
MTATTGTPWTIEAIRALGVTTDVETAGAILGIGRSKAYALAKRGKFPVRVLRVGRNYVVPVPEILELLGVRAVT